MADVQNNRAYIRTRAALVTVLSRLESRRAIGFKVAGKIPQNAGQRGAMINEKLRPRLESAVRCALLQSAVAQFGRETMFRSVLEPFFRALS